ncbi:ABC transporter ATP-binding protein, partial [Streptomyces pilosus]
PAARLAAPAAPHLVVPAAAGRPRGGAAREELTGGDVGADRLLPYGRPFVPGVDSLRTALDCAVLSPTGWAVAVGRARRGPGVVGRQTRGAAGR